MSNGRAIPNSAVLPGATGYVAALMWKPELLSGTPDVFLNEEVLSS